MLIKKIASYFSIAVGALMISMWSFFIFAGMIPEFETTPYSISLHLIAEGLTAILLIIGGIGLIKKLRWAIYIYLFSTGMLFYTIIVSPGYYLDLGQIYIPIMFVFLLISTIIITISLIHKEIKIERK